MKVHMRSNCGVADDLNPSATSKAKNATANNIGNKQDPIMEIVDKIEVAQDSDQSGTESGRNMRNQNYPACS